MSTVEIRAANEREQQAVIDVMTLAFSTGGTLLVSAAHRRRPHLAGAGIRLCPAPLRARAGRSDRSPRLSGIVEPAQRRLVRAARIRGPRKHPGRLVADSRPDAARTALSRGRFGKRIYPGALDRCSHGFAATGVDPVDRTIGG